MAQEVHDEPFAVANLGHTGRTAYITHTAAAIFADFGLKRAPKDVRNNLLELRDRSELTGS